MGQTTSGGCPWLWCSDPWLYPLSGNVGLPLVSPMQDTCLVRPERGSSRKHTSESQHPEGSSRLFLPSAYSRDPGSLVPLSEQVKHVGLVFELQGQSKEPQAKVVLLRGSLAPTQCWVPQFLRSRLGLLSMQLNINLCVSVCMLSTGGGQVYR